MWCSVIKGRKKIVLLCIYHGSSGVEFYRRAPKLPPGVHWQMDMVYIPRDEHLDCPNVCSIFFDDRGVVEVHLAPFNGYEGSVKEARQYMLKHGWHESRKRALKAKKG
jgi:hypothetical protein